MIAVIFFFITYTLVTFIVYRLLRPIIIKIQPIILVPIPLNFLRSILWAPGLLAGYGFAFPVPATLGLLINSDSDVKLVSLFSILIVWLILLIISYTRIALYLRKK